jgi:DNA polymerase III subunit gamma/tau
MSYTVLARKWRPKRFAELVGQQHVLKALVNALDTDRVHHAFLFSGTRGVGKTTIARILAKCLNCEVRVGSEPCGVCASCREIDEGRFVDLIEVDAASRTKIDDTRDLLDNVQYAPTRGRYKVYLIDEVHMLSAHSFNALLKTLEEPPPHVKFLLATTDPQKLPITVLSRCLQFNLKRLTPTMISERLKFILQEEKIAYDAAALRLLAQAADGSLRDALSLLDQLIAFGAGSALEDDARAMLGSIDRDHIVQLLQCLAGGDGAALMKIARALDEWAPDHAGVLDELAALLQRIALQQAVPDYADEDDAHGAQIARLAEVIAAEDVQLFYQTAILGRRDLALAPDPRTGFEMTLLRMLAFRPALASGTGERASASERGAGPAAGPAASPAQRRSAPQSDTAASSDAAGSWLALVNGLDLQGAAQQLAANCTLLGRDGNLVRLALDARHQLMRTRAQEEKLAQALSRHFGTPVRLEFELGAVPGETPAQAAERASAAALEAARRSLEEDATVLALQERFGATLHRETVRRSE